MIRTRQEGFALVDLLTAMAVLGLASSLLIGFVQFYARENAASLRQSQDNKERQAVERVLTLLLASAASFSLGKPPKSTVFGDSQQINIVSLGSPIFSLSEAANFHLGAEPDGGGTRMVMTWHDDGGQFHRRIIARDLKSFSFAYLPFQKPDAPAAWQSQWGSAQGAVSAVQVSVLSQGSSTSFLSVIPLVSDLPPDCLRDPRRDGCATRVAQP